MWSFCWKKKVCKVLEKSAEHDIHWLPYFCINDKWRHLTVTTVTNTLHCCQRDGIETLVCQGSKHSSCYSIIATVINLWCNLTYNSIGAWHTVYAMLLSNDKWNASWNSYNAKICVSQTYNSFSNNLILCYVSSKQRFKRRNLLADKPRVLVCLRLFFHLR